MSVNYNTWFHVFWLTNIDSNYTRSQPLTHKVNTAVHIFHWHGESVSNCRVCSWHDRFSIYFWTECICSSIFHYFVLLLFIIKKWKVYTSTSTHTDLWTCPTLTYWVITLTQHITILADRKIVYSTMYFFTSNWQKLICLRHALNKCQKKYVSTSTVKQLLMTAFVCRPILSLTAECSPEWNLHTSCQFPTAAGQLSAWCWHRSQNSCRSNTVHTVNKQIKWHDTVQ